MASNALKQLIEQADWGDLDYFPHRHAPGTSDIHLTLVADPRTHRRPRGDNATEGGPRRRAKGIAMFRDERINVPVLGIVDNMAWFTLQLHPTERYWPSSATTPTSTPLAEHYHVPVLARIPLVGYRRPPDAGSPIALEETMSAQASLTSPTR